MIISEITPVRISIDTKETIGVGRLHKKELLPTTPTLLAQLNITNTEQLNQQWNRWETQPSVASDILRDYQSKDATKAANRKVLGLFNEQRTGKTPTILSALKYKGLKRIIVVVPSSARLQWEDEVSKWYGGPSYIAVGSFEKRTQIYNDFKNIGGVLIISYETLRDSKSKSSDLDLLLKIKIDAIILDEAHRIRGLKSNQAGAIFKLAKHIEHRYPMTGTLAHKDSMNVFPILKFMFPTLFTSVHKFGDYYFEKEDTKIYTKTRTIEKTDYTKIKPHKQKELLEFINIHSVQRKRKEVMPWLPASDRVKIKLKLTKEQQKYIKDLEEMFETEHVITVGILDRLIRIRQICNAPAILNLKGTSPKIDWIKDYIKDYPDKPIIIFSKFTSFLNLLSKELKIGHLITGDVPHKTRDILKKKFQNGEINVLLINIDAGKEALTLDRAEVTIFCDKYAPIGDIQQAEDRFVATTIDKAETPKTIYELMMKDSYDELIYLGLEQSLEENDIINNYKKHLRGGEAK